MVASVNIAVENCMVSGLLSTPSINMLSTTVIDVFAESQADQRLDFNSSAMGMYDASKRVEG